jgi:hypothetical protein
MNEKLDKLNSLLTTKEQKKLLNEIKKQYSRQDKYANKLDLFFMRSLDGASPESLKSELGL